MKKGFSLIELIVAMAIIGVLAAAMAVGFSRQQAAARDTKRKADITTINNAVQSYVAANYEPPLVTEYTSADAGNWDYSSETGGVFVSGGDPDFVKFLKTSGYLNQVPLDPINNGTGDVHFVTNSGYAYSYFYYKSNRINGFTAYEVNAKLEATGLIVSPGQDYRYDISVRKY